MEVCRSSQVGILVQPKMGILNSEPENYAKKVADEDSLMADIIAQKLNHGNIEGVNFLTID